MLRIAILFDNFGPYHMARLAAAATKCDLLTIEVARRSGEYAWEGGEKQNAASKGQSAKGKEFGIECLFEGTSEGVSADAMVARLAEVLAAFRPSVVVVPGWASRAALAALRWAQEQKVPTVVMSESTAWDESRAAWKESVKRQVVTGFSAGLAGGAPHADYLHQLGLPRERVFLGYDAVDNDYFAVEAAKVRSQSSSGSVANPLSSDLRPPSSPRGMASPIPLGPVASAPFFLASARFIEKKNLPRLLQAYAQYRAKCEGLSAKSRPWDLVLLGDGELRPALTALRSALGLQHSVLLPGFKQYPDLPTYYGLAGAFIHASTTEQWGLVVNEAMASGLPVLVSNRCGCAPDLVQEDVNGFTFDPYDVEALAQLMLRVASMERGAGSREQAAESKLDTSPSVPLPDRGGEGGQTSGSAPASGAVFRALAENSGAFDEGVKSDSRGGCAPQSSTTLSQMGSASQRIIANWGPERFASGLKQAVDKALEVGPIKPTLLQRAILAALLRR